MRTQKRSAAPVEARREIVAPWAVVDVMAAAGLLERSEVEAAERGAVVDPDGAVYVEARSVREAGPDEAAEGAAGKIAAYWAECGEFWQRLDRGEEPGAYMAVRREVLSARQRDNQDLTEELAALEEMAGIGTVISAVLDAAPDLEECGKAAAGAGGRLWHGEKGEVCVRFEWGRDDVAYWPEALGGGFSPGEMSRAITVIAKHAAWRDRRARRLIRVEVEANELWPAGEVESGSGPGS